MLTAKLFEREEFSGTLEGERAEVPENFLKTPKSLQRLVGNMRVILVFLFVYPLVQILILRARGR
jgi:hypothetical protein